jgi:hypothetical protein
MLGNRCEPGKNKKE